MPTLLYSLDEQVRCQFSPEDYFVGHPHFPCGPGKRGVTELSMEVEPQPQFFGLISPLHCNTTVATNHLNGSYLDAVNRLLPRADVLFAIMGKYWWDQWSKSCYAHWMPKMVRLDMAVDVTYFPRIKRQFNPPGKRGFLYIGRNDPTKGTDFLSRIARVMAGSRFGWIGHGEAIEGVLHVSPARPLTPEFMAGVGKEYDLFVSPSIADANPTTILESMAWGFPVVCTPQSGYYETSYRKNIDRMDMDRSVDVLRQLQYAEEGELLRMADEARQVVEQDYTWDLFLDRICTRLGLGDLPG